MKKLFCVLSLMLPVTVFAAGNSTSNSNSSSQSGAAATNAGNAQSITFTSPGETTTTQKSTGAAVLPGFSGSFSGDYCGATAGVAAGGVGFSFSAGAPKIDESCVMLRTFERTQQAAAAVSQIDPVESQTLRKASLEILAEADPKVKAIFIKRGLIPNDAAIGSSTIAQPAPTPIPMYAPGIPAPAYPSTQRRN